MVKDKLLICLLAICVSFFDVFVQIFCSFKNVGFGNSLAIQWLGLGAFTADGPGSIPGQGTKIPQAVRHGQKTKTKQTNKQKPK